MNYSEAMSYLAEAGKRGIVPGLDSVRSLLRYLNDPQKQLLFVHVAGTNGKGSTAAMTASILSTAGCTTGRYTSPAVFDDRENYAVNGEWITETEYAACMTLVADAVSRMERDGLTLPTSFEIETALAMVFFLRRKCDIVVLETGMGGTMDATNVVDTTLVCILTAIGMDHTKFLGSTIEEIAEQKAGIIKRGADVVLHRQTDAVEQVIERACSYAGAPLTLTEPQCIENLPANGAFQCFRYKGFAVELPLAGAFQRDNAAGVIEAALLLRGKGFSISDEAILRGLKTVSWPGRLQRLRTAPDLYIDGAHNPNAAARLAESLPALLKGRRLICIMGVLADKDFSRTARLVCSQAARVITITPDNPRALNAAELARAVLPFCADTTNADSAADALESALVSAGKNDVILAFGSLSYLKDIAAAAGHLG